MATRDFIKHVVSTVEPAGLTVGDEYYNPSNNLLYKRVATNGTTPTYIPLNNNSISVDAQGRVRITTNISSTSTTTGTLIVTGGTGVSENLYVGGVVGIGTNSVAANQRLNVTGGRTALIANNETYSLWLQYGIGLGQYYVGATNSATPDLVCSNSAGTETLRISNGGRLTLDSTSEWGITFRYASNTTTNRATYLTQRALGTLTAPLAVTAGTIIGGLEAGGYTGASFTSGFNGGAAIQMQADGTWTAGSTPSTISFFTNATGVTSYTERLKIAANGVITMPANVASTSTTTGTLVITGGAGISENLYVGGTLTATNLAYTGTTTVSVSTISAAGTTQATATGITTDLVIVSTVAAGSGVRLPASSAGKRIVVRNSGANTLNIYPATGAQINSLALNVAFTSDVSTTLEFIGFSATQWYTVNATFA